VSRHPLLLPRLDGLAKQGTHRVSYMHEIYSKAQTIYISLGNWESRLAEESKCFVEGREFDDELGKHRRTFTYPVPQADGGVKDFKLSGPVSAVHASFAVASFLLKELGAYIFSETHWERLEPLGAVPTAWKIVADILNNPYWRRKWIVQEIALGADIQVMVSSFTVRWEDVLAAFVMVNRMVHPLANAEEDEMRLRINAQLYLPLLQDMGRQGASSILTIGQTIMALQERNLSNILLRLARPSTLQTSWKVDALYAVRALMQDFGDLPAPRYEQEYQDAYLEYTRWFVAHGFGAEILIARTHDGLSLALQERPTWSINWSSEHMTISKETISYHHSYYHGKRNDSKETARSEEMKTASQNIRLLEGSNRLQVTGSMLDTVAQALPQSDGCTNCITFQQACDFIAAARASRDTDTNEWVAEYLSSPEHETDSKLAFMKDHRALLEALETMLEQAVDTNQQATARTTARQIFEREDSMLHHFTLFRTAVCWSGFGPEHMEAGDLLITISGLPTVFVIRKEETRPEEYILIGQAEVIAHAGDQGVALAISREQQDFVIG
jgi:hypothetical protein